MIDFTNEHEKSFITKFNHLQTKRTAWQVFSDFILMTSCAISNSVDITKRDVRESLYMETVKGYSKDEANTMASMFADLVMTLETRGFEDVLGDLFSKLKLNSSWHGQFFTPMHVCKAMGKMSASDLTLKKVKSRGYINVLDPAVGGGALLIGFAHTLKEKGINFQDYMLATAVDIDIRSVYMSYIQLSLLGVPAIIYHGNTLTNEMFDVWYTPMYFVKGFMFRKQKQPVTFESFVERMRNRTNINSKEVILA